VRFLLPNLLQRRVAAAAIDVALVAVAASFIFWTQAEVIAVGTAEGTAIVAAGLRSQPLGLLDGLGVTARWGDTVLVWRGAALAVSSTITLLLVVLLLALLPANTGGSTPGLRLMDLRVTTSAGSPARLSQHLVRTAVGVVDLFPFAVPGLLGWLVAWRSPALQRLGDRVAGTVVVDRSGGPPAPAVRPGGATSGDIPPPVPRHLRPETRATSDTPSGGTRYATPVGDPHWSETWQAWAVRDAASERWFCYQPDADRWAPAPSPVEAWQRRAELEGGTATPGRATPSPPPAGPAGDERAGGG
jgi:uncharacterized RDD family membrane protein YckC